MRYAAGKENVVSVWHITGAKNRYPGVSSQKKANAPMTAPIKDLSWKTNNIVKGSGGE